MGPRQVSRNMFGLAFSSGAAAVFLIVTGLMGWEPPANLNLAESGWRRGAWTGGVIWSQVLFGIAFLVMADFRRPPDQSALIPKTLNRCPAEGQLRPIFAFA